MASLAESIMSKMSSPEESEGGDEMGLQAAAEEMLAAIEAKDATMLVSALKSAVAIIDSMPHEEGEHEGDEGEE
jgi:hypothetical protein